MGEVPERVRSGMIVWRCWVVSDILLIVNLAVALALVGVVLLQGPKGEGLGAIGGGARMFHGPRPRETLMLRLTATVAILFVLTVAFLAFSR